MCVSAPTWVYEATKQQAAQPTSQGSSQSAHQPGQQQSATSAILVEFVEMGESFSTPEKKIHGIFIALIC